MSCLSTETATANNVEYNLVKKSQFALGHLVKCETDPTGVYRQEDTLMELLQYVSAILTGNSIKKRHQFYHF